MNEYDVVVTRVFAGVVADSKEEAERIVRSQLKPLESLVAKVEAQTPFGRVTPERVYPTAIVYGSAFHNFSHGETVAYEDQKEAEDGASLYKFRDSQGRTQLLRRHDFEWKEDETS